jgi:hypothetical protein
LAAYPTLGLRVKGTSVAFLEVLTRRGSNES